MDLQRPCVLLYECAADILLSRDARDERFARHEARLKDWIKEQGLDVELVIEDSMRGPMQIRTWTGHRLIHVTRRREDELHASLGRYMASA